MDLLKHSSRRTRLSEIVYVLLNIGLAAALLIIVLVVQSPWLAYGVVLISKWRALAVRPRFWFANLVANMVDIIVGVSVVTFLYAASGALWLQVAISLLYSVWLLFIKPRSRRSYVALQAGIAVFVGISALSMVSYGWNVAVFVVAMWVIGYVSSRHILGSYDEPMTQIYSLIAGFMFAEFGWVAFHWLMAYPLPGHRQLQLSQLALFATLLCFVAERAYASYHKHGFVRRVDILSPVILTLSVMIVAYILALVNGTSAL
ncbi:MAG TPA: hypothetical protein PKV96_00610 [Candidatus Saccharimonas sp.]|jgi:hypothetical protein|nr:hypothetical protein [Candidatus Saccharimonas sp.]